MQASASSGCPICGLLWAAVEANSAAWYDSFSMKRGHEYALSLTHLRFQSREDSSGILYFREILEEDRGSVYRVFMNSRNPHLAFHIYELFTQTGTQPSSLAMIPSLREIDRIREASDLQVLKYWLRTCQRSHPECSIPQATLPSRVLQIHGQGAERVSLRLSNGKRRPYTALSHCWGSGSVPKTTRGNLATRQRGIPLIELPQSFLDAISVTRELGFRYLWIDSLCIIQDDQRDWEVESGRMPETYRNAELVIGADAAKDSGQGFLARKYTSARSTPIAVLKDRYRRRSLIRCRPRREHPTLESNPLAARGWTLQEQLLSRRMVHFAHEELFWECRSTGCCECGKPEGRNHSLEETLALKRRLETEMPQDEVTAWHQLVGQYTQRQFTFPSDILPALSGIASHLQSCGAGHYYAGLWKAKIMESLLWSGQNLQRAIPYRAPTWSWASVTHPDGQSGASFYGDTFKLLESYAEFLEASCLPSGHDPNGSVSSGRIVLEAPVFPAKLSHHPEQRLCEYEIAATLLEEHMQARIWPDKQLQNTTPMDIVCIILGLYSVHGAAGLVLRRSRDEEHESYERIGFLEVSDYSRTSEENKAFF